MAAKTWIKKMLERHGVDYEERYHRDAFTAQQVAEAEHVSGSRVAKVVVVVADGHLVELVLPATRRILFDRVREMLSASEVRLASEAEIERHLTEVEVGAMPPLRHWPDVPIIMDRSLKVEGDILMQAGTHTDAVGVCFDDWFNLVHPRVERFTVEAANGAAPGQQNPDRPDELHAIMGDLLQVLYAQAKEIERLTAHVERHTDRLLEQSEMPLIVSQLSNLTARLQNNR